VTGKSLSLKRTVPIDAAKSNCPDLSLEVLYASPTITRPPKQIGPSSFDIAQRLLSGYREHSKTVNRDIVSFMSHAGKMFLSQQKTKATPPEEEKHLKESLEAVLNKAYAVMESYADELNYRLGATDLRIGCTAPAYVTETCGQQNKTYLRARISSCLLSITVRASENKVEFYVLPTSQVMGLSATEDRHGPLMQFTATAHGAFIDWQVEGKALTPDRLERYSILLFNYLLDETKTEMAVSA